MSSSHPPKNQRSSYSTTDVANRLGVSLQTVQRWVDAGRLKAWRTPGGHRRIAVDDAEALIADYTCCVPEARPLLALVVDDDPAHREVLAHQVGQILPKARVEMAEDGFRALVLVARERPALVVTDVEMPHMDGFEMIRRLRADRDLRPQVLLAVSAHARADLEAGAKLPAGVRFLRKPIDALQLAAALRPLA